MKNSLGSKAVSQSALDIAHVQALPSERQNKSPSGSALQLERQVTSESRKTVIKKYRQPEPSGFVPHEGNSVPKLPAPVVLGQQVLGPE